MELVTSCSFPDLLDPLKKTIYLLKNLRLKDATLCWSLEVSLMQIPFSALFKTMDVQFPVLYRCQLF